MIGETIQGEIPELAFFIIKSKYSANTFKFAYI